MDWATVAALCAACVALAGLVASLVRAGVGNLNRELSARDDEQERQIDTLTRAVSDSLEKISATRTELHTDYAKRSELERLEQGVREDVNKVFEVVNGVSRDLNQMIGEFRAWAQLQRQTPRRGGNARDD